MITVDATTIRKWTHTKNTKKQKQKHQHWQDNENLNENDRCHDQFEGCIMMVPMHARLIRPAFQGFIRTQPVFPLQKEQQHQRQKYKYKYKYAFVLAFVFVWYTNTSSTNPCCEQSTLYQRKDDHMIFLLISPVQYCVTKFWESDMPLNEIKTANTQNMGRSSFQIWANRPV